jgi:site-specific recombinase XerC
MRRKDHDHVLALRRFRLAYVLKGSIFTVDDLMPPVRMRELTRRRITAFLVAKLGSGLSHASVRIVYAVLRRVLSIVVRHGLLLANPAAKLGNEDLGPHLAGIHEPLTSPSRGMAPPLPPV